MDKITLLRLSKLRDAYNRNNNRDMNIHLSRILWDITRERLHKDDFKDMEEMYIRYTGHITYKLTDKDYCDIATVLGSINRPIINVKNFAQIVNNGICRTSGENREIYISKIKDLSLIDVVSYTDVLIIALDRMICVPDVMLRNFIIDINYYKTFFMYDSMGISFVINFIYCTRKVKNTKEIYDLAIKSGHASIINTLNKIIIDQV